MNRNQAGSWIGLTSALMLCRRTAVTGPSRLVYANELSRFKVSWNLRNWGPTRLEQTSWLKSLQLLLKLMMCVLIHNPILWIPLGYQWKLWTRQIQFISWHSISVNTVYQFASKPLFPSGFITNILYKFISFMHATRMVRLVSKVHPITAHEGPEGE